MSVSGISARAENNLDEYERPLRAGGSGQASADDVALVELARKLAPVRFSPPAHGGLATGPTDAEPRDAAPPTAPGEASGTASLELEAPHASGVGAPCPQDLHDAGQAAGPRSRGWTLKASALAPAGAALVGAALVIAVFGPKADAPGAPKAPPFIAAARGATETSEPSGVTIAPRGDVDATRLKDIANVEVVRSEEQRADRDAGALPPSAPSAPPSAGAEQPAAWKSPAPPATPVASAEIAAFPSAASQSSNFNAARVASAPPDATAAPSAAHPGEAARHDAPLRPAEPAPMAANKAVAVAQPTTPKSASSAKLLKRASDRLMVAKTVAIAPGAAAETRSQPERPGTSIPRAPVEPQATPASAAAQGPGNPVTHTFGALAGARGAPAVDETASKSGDWGVQFAAPKSEKDAEAAAARLNAKYASALNGATIGVQKTVVNGETIYALRAAGLSKADAAALCVRVKGRDCSIDK